MTATTTKKTFSRETVVATSIQAPAAVVFQLLTDAKGFPAWNSTVIKIDGEIALGQKIALTSTLDPKRVFTLEVKAFEPGQRLVWGDAMGERHYTLSEKDGVTHFEMREKIGGPLFPLFAKMIPSFDASFDQFAADLKKAAEARART